ncbi:MAG: glycosyltransferase family 39 protein [Bacteroidetes bacterium]|nr:glycosyltransferase family 39 protein [Bacteroidota bacterium]
MNENSSIDRLRFYGLILLWLLSLVVVNPIGDFPLNDDWSYSINVFNLSENGIWKFSDWPGMILIAQTVWGAAFTTLFGFSFTVLRLSTLLVAFFSILIFWRYFKSISLSSSAATISCLVLIFNPIFFSLSNSFMTEVPFITVFGFSAFLYSRYSINNKTSYLLAGTLFAIFATLIRQPGVWLPIAFLITYLISRPVKIKQLIPLVLSCVVVVSALTGYLYWLKSTNRIPEMLAMPVDLFGLFGNPGFATLTWHRTMIIFFYVALFLLPVLIYIIPGIWKESKNAKRWLMVIISCVLAIPLLFMPDKIPLGNILSEHGIGPKTVKDTYWSGNMHPTLPAYGLDVLRWIGIASAALLYYCMIHALRRLRKSVSAAPLSLFALIIIVGYCGFLLLASYFFDRYILLLVPFVIIFIWPKPLKTSKFASAVSFAVVAIFILFTIAGTHDYISWNRAKWKGLNKLMENGIKPGQIDGGFEFNGWYETGPRTEADPFQKSWWFVDDDEYAAAMGPLCNYEIINHYTFRSFLTMRRDSIYILQRINTTDTIRIFSDVESLTADRGKLTTTDPDVLFGNADARVKGNAHSGNYYLELDKKHIYGFSTTLKDIIPCEIINVSFWFISDHTDAGIVVAYPRSKMFYNYKSIDKHTSEDDWQFMTYKVIIPMNYPWDTVQVYLWFRGENPARFDDFMIERIK